MATNPKAPPSSDLSRARVNPEQTIVQCPTCRQPVAKSEINPSGLDLVAEARLILTRAMRGQLKPSDAEVQRKAALDILDRGHLEHLSDEDLLAEVKRRRERAEKKP